MAVLLIAGLAKGLSFHSFALSLSGWAIIPESLRTWVGIMVIFCEVMLGGLWFLGIARRPVVTASVLMLVLFTGAYAWQAAMGRPPDCQCLGRLLAFRAEQGAAPFIVARNLALIAGLLVWLVYQRPADRSSGQALSARVAAPAARGFTLVETLVVIVIIAVLIAIVVPSLAAVRRLSKTASSLSRLREHAGVLHAYTTDWQETFPRFIEPDGSHRMAEVQQDYAFFSDRYPYFAQAVFWPLALQDGYYSGMTWYADVFNPPWHRADLDADKVIEFLDDVVGYQYAATCVSRPEFWMQIERTGPAQWLGVRASEISSPSLKVLMSSTWNRPGRPAEGHAAFGDASAQARPATDFEPAYPGGEGRFSGEWSLFADWPIGSHTVSGVRGRDVRRR